MKVDAIDITPFKIPLRHPVELATGTVLEAEHILLQVKTVEGAVGTAEIIPRPMIYGETTASALYALEHLVAPHVLGCSLLEAEHLWHQLRNVMGNQTVKGALELAMFDALAESLGVPAFRLLGGFTSAITCTGLVEIRGRPKQVVELALGLCEGYGIRSFKFKVGLDMRTDIEVVRALRRELGPTATLYPDASHAFSPFEALRFLRATEEYELAWIEEPCPSSDVLGRQRVCKLSPVPVMGDESCTDLESVTKEVLDARSNMISIKLARTGILGSTRIRNFCEATGTGVLIGSQGDSAVGTLASAAFAAASPATARHPAELAYFVGLQDNLLRDPLEIVEGQLRLREVPGFGITLDSHKLKRYAPEGTRTLRC
jgi:L-alanine-DL-glutamate epimerase-like enolase superfamily enzyme